MKKYKVAVQSGLDELKKLLTEKGHEVLEYEKSGLCNDVVVITGVDSEYEEIETAQCRLACDGKEMLLINASKLTPEQVLHHIENNHCS